MGRLELPTKADVAKPFRSRAAFVDFVKAPQGNEGHETVGNSKWSNKDLEPTPVEQRNWTWYAVLATHTLTAVSLTGYRRRYNLPLYWFSNQFSLVGWNTGSSLVAVGLVGIGCSWKYCKILTPRRHGNNPSCLLV